MRARQFVTLLGPGFLLALVQLVAALLHPLAGMLAGFAVGGLAWGAQKLLDIELAKSWLLPLAAFSASSLGILIRVLTLPAAGAPLFLAPFLAAGVAAVAHMSTQDDLRRCETCNRRLTAGRFECPRCGKTVCEQGCWNFESCRCRRCEEDDVPLLRSMERAWWERQTGPRIRQGRCQLCLTPAEKTDLRTCHRCGRLYCRGCWDIANGQCRSCLWTIPGVPDRVRKYLIHDDTQPREERYSRPGRRTMRHR